jgi:hypothetical protein
MVQPFLDRKWDLQAKTENRFICYFQAVDWRISYFHIKKYKKALPGAKT